MLRIQNRILKLIADSVALDETARQICLSVEAAIPGVACSILTVDRGGLMHPLAGPSLPAAYSASLDGIVIGPAVGSCGTAAYLRAPVTVPCMHQDARFAQILSLLDGLDLKACWSTPVLDADGSVIGVLAAYSREERSPRNAEQQLLAACAELCATALARHERVADRERRASVDALTGLPNRSAFNAALANIRCDEPGSWALLVLDLDNLKVVNDTFGHQAGDALIRVAGKRITKVMSPDVTFRLGGDEFAIIVQRQEFLADLESASMRIFSALEQPAEVDGHSFVPSTTIGGAILVAGDEGAESVYQNADFALYHAKETGRGGFVRYWPGIGTRITHRRDAIRDVGEALSEDRIDAHYQPVVRLDTREIIGVEALCRLRTHAGEIVAASAFHEATKDARVATRLTERMLETVAGDVRHWIEAGIPFQHVGVNVSTADFYTGSLRNKLQECFGRAGVSLDHLILEVNEDVYIGRRDKVVARQIAQLRESGLRVALDDFGTGYASLTHLLNVPVDAIKIDRSFIVRLWPDDPSTAIVQGLIDIASRLGIRIVAEGIETEVQASQLWAMGCKLGQGFAFSKAVDRGAMTELLRRHAQGLDGVIPLYPRESDRHDVESDPVRRTGT